MMKQTVYLNNFARKSGIPEAVCLLDSPLLERSDDLSNNPDVQKVCRILELYKHKHREITDIYSCP